MKILVIYFLKLDIYNNKSTKKKKTPAIAKAKVANINSIVNRIHKNYKKIRGKG